MKLSPSIKDEIMEEPGLEPEVKKTRRATVAYVYDPKLSCHSDKIPNIRGRARLVHDLIQAYDLTKYMECINSKPATFEDLKIFHSSAYVDFLAALKVDGAGEEEGGRGHDKDGESDTSDAEDEEEIEMDRVEFQNEFNLTHEDFGFNYECPLFKNLGEFACGIAGGTLTGCRALLEGWRFSINWCGGWHHAHRDEARGFCTVNDIVLGCHLLQKKFSKILYIDLDAHHGDGVESAFSSSQSVFTFSIHTQEAGFYPGTGKLCDVGIGRGKYYTVNAPLKHAVTDQQFVYVFQEVLTSIEQVYPFQAVVVQCGVDGLTGDPLGAGNLTEKGLGACVSRVLEMKKPTLFLGGGGYNKVNAAKCWAYLTSIISGVSIDPDIPDHSNFLLYGPDYDLNISASLRKSSNTPEYIQHVVSQIKDNLKGIDVSNHCEKRQNDSNVER